MWPNGKRCAIGLSHDVDNPYKYSILRYPPLFSNTLAPKQNLLLALRKINALRKRVLDDDPEGFWLFKEVMDTEEKFGFKSTFFFSAVNRFHKWASPYDVAYEIDSPRFVNPTSPKKRLNHTPKGS